MDPREYREIMEAVQAGEDALEKLRIARRDLIAARGLGVWDIFGGKGVVSLAKHGMIAKANYSMHNAERSLQYFLRELDDVPGPLHVNTGIVLSFFDIFQDNIIADVMMQRRIVQAQRSLDDIIDQVTSILDSLRGYLY